MKRLHFFVCPVESLIIVRCPGACLIGGEPDHFLSVGVCVNEVENKQNTPPIAFLSLRCPFFRRPLRDRVCVRAS